MAGSGDGSEGEVVRASKGDGGIDSHVDIGRGGRVGYLIVSGVFGGMVGGEAAFSVCDETGGFLGPGFSVVGPGIDGESLIVVLGVYAHGNRDVLGEVY